MTLDECLDKREITKYFDSITYKYQGMNYQSNIGDEFGRLKIVYLVQYLEGKTKRKGCICECKCGNFIGPSRIHMIQSNELISCGCYSSDIHREQMIDRNTIHGDSKREGREKLYIIWAAMKDRCSNLNRDDSKYYSDKGIKVCDDWQDYTKFKTWALENGYSDGLSIERKDNSKGYNPENCIWIELKDQNKNKTTSRILEYNGEKHNITDWCRITGLCWSTIDRRLKAGKSVGQALGFEK